jgi:hypothetical protein
MPPFKLTACPVILAAGELDDCRHAGADDVPPNRESRSRCP